MLVVVVVDNTALLLINEPRYIWRRVTIFKRRHRERYD